MPGILKLSARIETGHEKGLKERAMVLRGALDGPGLRGQGSPDLQVSDLQKILVSRNRTPDPHRAGMSA